MSIISAYILRQTSMPLLLTIGLALLILLTERMLRLLDLVLDSTGSFFFLVRMLGFLVPHYLALALPVGFFLGILLTFNRLQQNSELDALGSAGISVGRLIRPVVVLSVFLAILSLLNFSVLQPYSRYIYRALVHDVSERTLKMQPRERAFMEVEGVTFMVEDIFRRGPHFSGIFIHRQHKGGGSTVITAAHGRLVLLGGGRDSYLLLKNGVHIRTGPTPEKLKIGANLGTGPVSFAELSVPFDIQPPDVFRSRGGDERELTLQQLWQQRHAPPPGITSEEMLAEFNDRVVRSATILFLPLFALIFVSGGRRTQRAYSLVAGLLTLAVFNEGLSVGKSLVSVGQVSPLIGHWALFIIFAVGSSVFYYRMAYRPPAPHWLPEPLGRLMDAIRSRLSGIVSARRQRA